MIDVRRLMMMGIIVYIDRSGDPWARARGRMSHCSCLGICQKLPKIPLMSIAQGHLPKVISVHSSCANDAVLVTPRNDAKSQPDLNTVG